MSSPDLWQKRAMAARGAELEYRRKLEVAEAEIERLRAEVVKFEAAWIAISDKYESLLLQLGATDA